MKYRQYHQFTRDDRIRLEVLYNAGTPVKEIATRLPYRLQSIYREIKRGLYQHKNYDWTYTTKYSADKAEEHARYNATAKGRQPKVSNDHSFIAFVEKLILEKGYSPAAALAYIRNNHLHFQTHICLRTLYNYIEQGYFLHLSPKNLPYRGKRKKHRQNKGRSYKRLSAGKGIEERPKIVYTRTEFGHWELDTVIGKKTKGQTMLVMTERKTRTELIFRSPNKTALSTVSLLNRLEHSLGTDFSKIFRTITVDNGTEFQYYELMEKSLIHDGNRTQIYYCHPFASSERGSNEKNNQMIRRKIPKGTRIEAVSDDDLAAVQQWLNTYPRGIFGYRSSLDLFEKELKLLGVENFFEKIHFSS